MTITPQESLNQYKSVVFIIEIDIASLHFFRYSSQVSNGETSIIVIQYQDRLTSITDKRKPNSMTNDPLILQHNQCQSDVTNVSNYSTPRSTLLAWLISKFASFLDDITSQT
jgi:hypothetical protein